MWVAAGMSVFLSEFQAEAMAKASADRGRAQRVAGKREAMPESPVRDGMDIWIWMVLDFLVDNCGS